MPLSRPWRRSGGLREATSRNREDQLREGGTGVYHGAFGAVRFAHRIVEKEGPTSWIFKDAFVLGLGVLLWQDSERQQMLRPRGVHKEEMIGGTSGPSSTYSACLQQCNAAQDSI
eukprot:3120573-Rhodomonas_salina.1